VRAWDVLTGDNIHVLTGHTDSVTSVVFSHDPSIIFSGCGDNRVRMFSNGTLLQILHGLFEGSVHALAYNGGAPWVRALMWSPRFEGLTQTFGLVLMATARACCSGLPGELWEHVFGFLNTPSRLAVGGVGVTVYEFDNIAEFEGYPDKRKNHTRASRVVRFSLLDVFRVMCFVPSLDHRQ
jgi:hypothetical protein